MTIKDLRAELKHHADVQRAKDLQRFFKTDKGDYGEGDVFLGITVPQSRLIIKQFWRDLNPVELQQLLDSKIHEERFIALLCLIEKYNEYHRRLLTIKPGVSGMAQVSGRSDLQFENEYKLDVYYIENWSLWLDVSILFRTIPVVVLGTGAK